MRLAMLRPSRRQLRRWRRDQRTRQVIVGAAVGLVVLVLAILGFGYWRENFARAGEPAATVFGETITMSQLLERVRPRAQALDAQARFYEGQGITQAAAQLNLQRSRLPDQVLDLAIEEMLVRRESAQRGLTVTDEELDARIRKEIAEQEALNQPSPTATPSPAASPASAADASPTAQPTATPVPTLTSDQFPDAYQRFLTRSSLTDDLYRDLIRSEMYKEELRSSMGATVPRTEEQVHARHILVDNQESLDRARQMLADGTPFDQVAKELSTDTATRDKGGDLGWFGRGVMNAPFEQAAFTQPIGEIGEPIQSPNGFHIVQVLEKDPEHPLTENQIDGRANQAYQAWYAGLKGSSDVQNQLTPERRAWILRQIGTRRAG